MTTGGCDGGGGGAMVRSFRDTLAQLFKARFPILYIESHEEQRVVGEIRAVAGDASRIRTPRGVWTWSATEGLIQPDGVARNGTKDPLDALDAVLRLDQPCVAVFKDLHSAHGNAERPGSPAVVRRLRDVATAF